MKPTTPRDDFDFRPDGYGHDPLEDVFRLIPDGSTRDRVWRLLRQESIEEMETTLRWAGILRPDGSFDQDAYPDLEWERPEDIEGEETTIAFLTSEDYSNIVGAARVGWYWEIEGCFDGICSVLDRSTVPISKGSLIDLLDATGLVDHFRWNDEEVIWESDVYPGLGEYYLRGHEQHREQTERRDEGTGMSEGDDQSASSLVRGTPPSVAHHKPPHPVPDSQVDPDADLKQIQVLLLRYEAKWREKLSQPLHLGWAGGQRWQYPNALKAAAERLDHVTPVEAYHILLRLRSEANMPTDLIDSVLGFLTYREDPSQ
jgi:hypothetical protein